MYRKKSTIIIVLAILMAIIVIGLFSYLGYKYYLKNSIGSSGNSLDKEIIIDASTEITDKNTSTNDVTGNNTSVDMNSISTINPSDLNNNNTTDENNNTDSSDKKATYKGFETGTNNKRCR